MNIHPRISVVIPVLNEERRIAQQLLQLRQDPGLDEVIVVDGGSDDRTVALANRFAEVVTFTTERGRAVQMNAGAARASGDILVFLHADVTLPSNASELIRSTLDQANVIAGAFRTWTVPDGTGISLGPLLHLADIRSRVARLPYGDQAIFVRSDVFSDVGGYPNLPLMEDLALSARLRKLGRIARLSETVRVSGRRFESRPLFYTLLTNLFPTLYRLGVPTKLLAALYRNPR